MYKEFFGFNAKPFQLSPDVRFFFPSSEHRKALSFLQYGVSQGEGFIVITGGPGTGKTTLVQALLAELNPEEIVAANIVTTNVEADDLLGVIATQLGIRRSAPSKSVLLRDLHELFLRRAKEGKRILLIVDEVQNLPPRSLEELRMLSNFSDNGRSLVQAFLLGQEEFRATLLQPPFEQLRQRVAATYQLNALNEEETHTYIEHRLSKAGWTGDPVIDDGAISAIYAFTEGVPRRINNLCDRVLLFAYLEERHDIDAAMVDAVATEISSEFVVSDTQRQRDADKEEPNPRTDQSAQPLESMARMMFDKANVQQRLSALERAVDSLGHNLMEELASIRVLLEELSRETRGGQKSNDPAKRKRAS